MIELGLKILPSDEAFYYWNEYDNLRGAVFSHMEDFIVAGSHDIIKKIVKDMSEKLKVANMEYDFFRFTCWDLEVKKSKRDPKMFELAERGVDRVTFYLTRSLHEW